MIQEVQRKGKEEVEENVTVLRFFYCFLIFLTVLCLNFVSEESERVRNLKEYGKEKKNVAINTVLYFIFSYVKVLIVLMQ